MYMHEKYGGKYLRVYARYIYVLKVAQAGATQCKQTCKRGCVCVIN